MPVSGLSGDQFSYVPVAVGGLGISIASLGMLLLADRGRVVCAGVFGFGLSVWAFSPVVQATS